MKLITNWPKSFNFTALCFNAMHQFEILFSFLLFLILMYKVLVSSLAVFNDNTSCESLSFLTCIFFLWAFDSFRVYWVFCFVCKERNISHWFASFINRLFVGIE